MNKVSEYSDRIISRLKLDLENELILSIYDMLKDEGVCKVDIDLTVNSSTRLVYIEIYEGETEEENTIEITKEYLATDGRYYTDYCSLNDLDLNELYCLWIYIKGLA